MGCFTEGYDALRYPIEDDDAPGWRLAQLGAVHALPAHFYSKADRALVAMPTGSGKSAVFMAMPYVLRSRRMLVLTPSRVVRDQFASDFSDLSTLKAIGALPANHDCPRVRVVRRRSDVEKLSSERDQYDVAVAVPAVFQRTDFAGALPADLFDVLVVDEAHHVAAPTWNGLTSHFKTARQALFTATPVRRDRRRLGAEYIYVYTMSQAIADGVFGKINFVPAAPVVGYSVDEVIALETEAVFLRDQASHLDHRILVRVDSRDRADELGDLYEQQTGLRLRAIHSGHAYSRVKGALEALKNGDLDGIIAVDMLGEGFDFPKLKIAAVHTPHKSLAATLQFIGRFARTNADDVGEATFVAAENDIKHEAEALWRGDNAWHEIVPALADECITRDLQSQSFFGGFESRLVDEQDQEALDLVVDSLTPNLHAKVFALEAEPDLEKELELPPEFDCRYDKYSDEAKSRVIALRERIQPHWSTDPRVTETKWHLVVMHYEVQSRTLFVASSLHSDALYESLVRSVSDGRYSNAPMHRLHRVLRGLNGVRCFSLGMRNSLCGSVSESYRIMAGPSAEGAIGNADKRTYHQGHVFATGDHNGVSAMIGFSGNSKLWAAGSRNLSELVAWFDTVGAAMADGSAVVTGTQLDDLEKGSSSIAPMPPFIGALWPETIYTKALSLVWDGGKVLLRDLDIELPGRANANDAQVLRIMRADDVLAEMLYDATATPCLSAVGVRDLDVELKVVDHRNNTVGGFLTFCRNQPPLLYADDFAVWSGQEYFQNRAEAGAYDSAKLRVFDWAGRDVYLKAETSRATIPEGMTYIIDAFASDLCGDFRHVFIDDGSGEAADIIAMAVVDGTLKTVFVHCKASKEETAGARVDDVYVVSGQVVKSVRLAGATTRLRDHLRKRATSIEVRAGSVAEASLLLQAPVKKTYEVWLVQPGISAAGISEGMLRVLGCTEDYVMRAGCTAFAAYVSG